MLGALASSAYGHGVLQERIVKLTGEIAVWPQNAALYLQRAELYRQHQQFNEALADLEVARMLVPTMSAVSSTRARVFAESGQITNALAEVESLLKDKPEHQGALVIRARCRLALNQVQAAIDDFTRAIAASKSAEPDLYLERARACAAAGQFANAVRGLDEGVARLGALLSLQLAAIEYERQNGVFDDALARVDKILAAQMVKEPWQVLRGEILVQAGRWGLAREAFQQALAGIDKYPPVRRGLDLTVQLQARAREGLTHVEHKQPSAAEHVAPQ